MKLIIYYKIIRLYDDYDDYHENIAIKLVYDQEISNVVYYIF